MVVLSNEPRRPIRIGNAAGAIGDGIDQVYRLALDGNVDAITGDFLAEFNLAWRAIEFRDQPDLGYEAGFLDQLAWKDGEAARLIASRGIKVVNNGGALNPRGLATKVAEYYQSLGISNVKIAYVTDDDMTAQVRKGEHGPYKHLDINGLLLQESPEKILSANAYTGHSGIIAALEAGADIVICGRCTDASPVMGLASWWHGWAPDDYDKLAHSLYAGHLIECGGYITGGNFCGFTEVDNLYRVGYPIAEIGSDGTVIITKPNGTNGVVSVDTVKAQSFYEIQGPFYLNPDVIAKIDEIKIYSVGEDRIKVSGLVGLPPPATTKLAICLDGGYQGEVNVYCAGLNVEEKVAMMRTNVMRELDLSKYTTVSIQPYGTAKYNPRTQAECTVLIRHFVQAPTKDLVRAFGKAVFYNGIQGFCGLHIPMDLRALEPKPFVKYFPSVISQELISLSVGFLGDKETSVFSVPKKSGGDYTAFNGQESYDPRQTTDLQSFGESVQRPFGDLVFARSGDKAGNANVGLWVRDAQAWPWLQSFLTIDRMKYLLGDEYKEAYNIERYEAPNLWGVHFVVYGILGDGVSSSAIVDGFAKSFGEFIRARVVDLPITLVEAEDAKRQRRTSSMLSGSHVDSPANHASASTV